MQFGPDFTPVAIEFFVVLKLNHLEVFGISWFAEFNPQIDWHNHSESLDLDENQCTVVAKHTANSFAGINLCNVN